MEIPRIEKFTDPKDIVVVGASTSMEINKNIFKGRTFFNNSVSGATIEDYMGIYGLYKKRAILPKTFIIGTDQWIFNKNNSDASQYYTYIEDECNKHDKFSIFKYYPHEKYFELVSFNYFRRSIWKLIGNLRGIKRGTFVLVEARGGNATLKLADGSIRYANSIMATDPKTAREMAISYANAKPVYGLNNFVKMDGVRISLFKNFLSLLKKDGVSVIIYIPPCNPAAYQVLIKNE